MASFYAINSARVSFREYWWGARSPTVVIVWILKLLRVPLPSSSDDPPVATTLPFLVNALPADVATGFAPLAEELAALGFVDPVYHTFKDDGTATTLYWATFRLPDGQHFARIHQRFWQQAASPDRGRSVRFLTPFHDGTFVESTSGKPDWDAPKSVQVHRQVGATATALWRAHQKIVEARTDRTVQPVDSPDALLAAIERHHVLMRDFHISRGVFRERSEMENEVAVAVATRWEEATAAGWQNPEVLAEVERLQSAKPSWGNAVLILLVSILAFVAAGSARREFTEYLWLIPILFLHETGHWLMMKCFGYRNMRMFFIPLFGAAVSGRKWNIPGWKKALVSLAGPVPGIWLGVALAIAGLVTGREWMNHAALLLLILNGFNLLPVLPLDGGHVLHAILFCRNRWLDLAFRVAAIIGLFLLSLGGGRFMMFLAIAMSVQLPVVYKLGKVTDLLRRTPLPPVPEGEDQIPLALADTIATEVKAALAGKISSKAIAQHTVNVFETLNARPPGIGGTLGLLAIHGSSVFAVVLCGFLLILNRHGGGLGGIAQAIADQPAHEYNCGDQKRWDGKTAAEVTNHNVVVATLTDPAASRRRFVELSSRLPPEASLVHLGESLLLALPASAEAAREKWFAELSAADTNTFVAVSNQSVTAKIIFIAPTPAGASNLVRELNGYFMVSRFSDLIPPWSPQAHGAAYETARLNRQIWQSIGESNSLAMKANEVVRFRGQITAARKRGALAEAERLGKLETDAITEAQTKIRQQLRTQGLDPHMLELHARQFEPAMTNRAARATLNQEIGVLLGARPPVETAASAINPYGTSSGFAHQQGMLIEINWVGFRQPLDGFPALLEWLCQQHCSTIKYQFFAAGADIDESDE